MINSIVTIEFCLCSARKYESATLCECSLYRKNMQNIMLSLLPFYIRLGLNGSVPIISS